MAINDMWGAYAPSKALPWDLKRVVHLHRRAGFAGTWDELQRDLQEGPEKSIDRLLTGKANSHTPEDFAKTSDILADSAVSSGEIGRLKAWWFYRMIFGPDSLGEKLTLLWHDHFATGYSKVEDVAQMRRQNETLRKYARGKFSELLNGSVREPALLFYLDAQTNRKGHPNENLGRELMELFTLGVGNYTEADVKEAARCLTGWSVEDGVYAEIASRHDDGEKNVLNQKGKWTGADLVGILLKNPATAHRMAMKLCRQFFGEKAISSEAIKSLSSELRDHDLDIHWAIGTILKSNLFFADPNIGNRVLGPVEYIVGATRALGLFDPAPSTLALADWSARIGQDLFDPPNVGGWPHGRAWIHTRSMIARSNFASALIQGPNAGLPTSYDPTLLPKKFGSGSDSKDVLVFHHRLLFGTDPGNTIRKRVEGADSRSIVEILLASPEAQLG